MNLPLSWQELWRVGSAVFAVSNKDHRSLGAGKDPQGIVIFYQFPARENQVAEGGSKSAGELNSCN